jgi:hypothetical protein
MHSTSILPNNHSKQRREVAAQAALTSQSVTPMASNAISPPSPQQIPAPREAKEEAPNASAPPSTSSWSSLMGLWAWKKDVTKEVAPVAQTPAQNQVQDKGKP